MLRRKRKYKALFWCNNCGADFKVKLPFGVMPVQHNEMYFLFDMKNNKSVDQKGRPVSSPVYPRCSKCGSYEIVKVKWHVVDKSEND